MEENVIHKKKLKDLALEEFERWREDNCSTLPCDKCIFKSTNCNFRLSACWVNNKEIFNDEFLNQEIKIKGNIIIDYLSDSERNYLKAVIRPFKDKVNTITKRLSLHNSEYIEINVKLNDDHSYAINLLPFEKNTKYKKMVLYKEYTTEELWLFE